MWRGRPRPRGGSARIINPKGAKYHEGSKRFSSCTFVSFVVNSSESVPANLPEIHTSAIILQHDFLIIIAVTCSSNRESQGQSRGAPGCLFSFWANSKICSLFLLLTVNYSITRPGTLGRRTQKKLRMRRNRQEMLRPLRNLARWVRLWAIVSFASTVIAHGQAPATVPTDEPPVTLFPHSETARYWISGQDNIIFQWHPSFDAAYSGAQ